MSDEKFTQGEWVNENTPFESHKGREIWSGEQNCVAIGIVSIHDAHLIAAAPKMYRLLQKFIPCDEDGNGAFIYEDGSEYLGSAVNELLAEAHGE